MTVLAGVDGPPMGKSALWEAFYRRKETFPSTYAVYRRFRNKNWSVVPRPVASGWPANCRASHVHFPRSAAGLCGVDCGPGQTLYCTVLDRMLSTRRTA